ncbi:HAMP domain-containing sensor histidine kinase [Tuwongella immobilis]|uniref:histidine kinase n=1 Tax=Tuwongella immobilis TaxID=692036 RepID=A0A6C2YQR8_9BACT|nr:ATP-binding protein [Tuwongella immobilis]VIP03443.1 histidine kinase : Histidine kinase OS=Planctomyces maris DSM 8797 GN=PM8797T_06627 PE=4 SV=1: HAMP: PAS_4: HisKA: HATPase_c [Tuwongella immobilis]VTS04258.1 histidine kinase : Histidine kinase OS=Planctomyces maris DSM 8797 GN=PM8797T_06627 PE=4 SV=1: HAMP: PAS_4: HisKA: HATPase_c [Tuwongella immobilis]
MFWRLFASVYSVILGVGILFTLVVIYRSSNIGMIDFARDMVIVSAVVLLLSAIPLLVVTRNFAGPIQDLTTGAKRISEGDYGFKIHLGGMGENQSLARAFNEMSEELAQQFAQLEQDRQQLRTILGGMVEGVVAFGHDQRILFANERAGWFLEFNIQDAIGRKFWEVVRHRAIHEVLNRAGQTEQPHREEIDWIGRGVKSLAIYVAQLPDGPSPGTILVLHDTTKLRQLERLRQEFVANVSHELKTPLSVIKACVETLLDGAAEDEQSRAEFLIQISEQGDRLYALILDLLSLAKIESGNPELELEAIPLIATIEDCLDRHRPRAEVKHQSLIADFSALESPDDVLVWADEEALSQILDNLVDNAVKYTPEQGQVRIRCWPEGENQFGFEVSDTGIGIPERDLPRIFERFYRVDKGRSREVGGTGLGLAIVKHLVQVLNGSIRATSSLGHGTTFTILLPKAREA